jgi:hypothetical protein
MESNGFAPGCCGGVHAAAQPGGEAMFVRGCGANYFLSAGIQL